jgi:hypothetical protein
MNTFNLFFPKEQSCPQEKNSPKNMVAPQGNLNLAISRTWLFPKEQLKLFFLSRT